MRLVAVGLLSFAVGSMSVLAFAGANAQFSRGDFGSAEAQRIGTIGYDAMSRQDYAAAIGPLSTSCTGGNAPACVNLALLYTDGLGVPKDGTKAAALYEIACDRGNGPGCERIGMAYMLGRGTALNKERAAKLLQRSCDLKYGQGCMNAGVSYANGEGVALNNERAAYYYGLACDYGKAQACTLLAALKPSAATPAQRWRESVIRGVGLWAKSKGDDIIIDTVTVADGYKSGLSTGSYDYRLPNGGKGTSYFEARMYGGELCITDAQNIAKICADIPANQADADRRYAIAVGKRAQAAKEAADVEARAPGQVAGMPISAADQACLKTFSETYEEYAEGPCVRGYYTRLANGSPGPYVCTEQGGGMETRVRNYEKNVCTRPIRFKDQCGSTIFAWNLVKPGARFDRKFSYPCGRVY